MRIGPGAPFLDQNATGPFAMANPDPEITPAEPGTPRSQRELWLGQHRIGYELKRARRPLTQQEQDRLMRHLAMMRMVCDTTYILDPEVRDCPKLAELEKVLEECRDNEGVKVIGRATDHGLNIFLLEHLAPVLVELRIRVLSGLLGGVLFIRVAESNDILTSANVRVALAFAAGADIGAMKDWDFLEVYRYLLARFPPEKAALMSERVFRGGVVEGGAPFTKDAAYQRGYCRTFNFLRAALEQRDVDLVLAERGAVVQVPVLQELVAYYTRGDTYPQGLSLDAPIPLPAGIREITVQTGRAVIVQ